MHLKNFLMWLPLVMVFLEPKSTFAALKEKTRKLKGEASAVPSFIRIPPKNSNQETSVLIAIKLTNVSLDSILLTRYRSAEVELISADKKVLMPTFGWDHWRLPELNDFLWLGPSRSTYIMTDCHLFWFNGELCLGGDENSGGRWSIKNIKAGKYMLVLRYKPTPVKFGNPHWKDQRGLPRTEPWYGEVATGPIPFEIKGEGAK